MWTREKMRQRSIYFGLLLWVVLLSEAVSQESAKIGALRISSPAFTHQGQIPGKYGCAGANINPPLKIENVPAEAKSLALIFDDKDAPRGTYVHWILWNIRPETEQIKEDSVPEGAIQGKNDFKKNNYGGPCPPTRPHRYVLKLYALDVRLDLSPESTAADFGKAIEGHLIAEAQWTGVYKRK
jgi:Raf kinase inhibitor-like YbhB/YbcL family protein